MEEIHAELEFRAYCVHEKFLMRSENLLVIKSQIQNLIKKFKKNKIIPN